MDAGLGAWGPHHNDDMVPGARVGLVVLAATALACGRVEPTLVDESRVVMGSALRVAVWSNDRDGAMAATARVFDEFDRLDRLLSVWHPDSDVSRLNASAGQGPVRVGPETRRVLQAAVEAGRQTDGKFDVTFGALTDVWRFDHDQDNRVPTSSEVAARLPFVDSAFLSVDDSQGTAQIQRAGVRVHLGGIGKGYAIDRAAALLRDAGFQHFLLQAGGDLYAAGTRGDRPWRVGVHDPRGSDGDTFATLDVRDETFSTSGDYERFFIADGVRYHHLLDPDTGQPARGCRSVTVLARDALTADWASTGVFILGPKAGLSLVERLPDVEAVIVTADNEVLVSSGLKTRLRIDRPPTP